MTPLSRDRPWRTAEGQYFGTTNIRGPIGQFYVDSLRPAQRRSTCDCAGCEARQEEKRTAEYMAKLEAPTDVGMTWKVRRALQDEAERMGDRLEAGGFLFGRIEPHVLGRDIRAVITGFSHCRSEDQREPGRFTVSRTHLHEAFRDPNFIGCWHTHVKTRTLEPSEVDCGAWSARADEVSWRPGRPPGYIGLILTSPGTWNSWGIQMRAYFAQPLRYDIPPEQREPRPIAIREMS
jgi:hypothetical protein